MIEARAKSFAELVGFHAPAIAPEEWETHGTTVLALRFDGGVVILADRRATMGNLVMFDRAEKIIALDDSTVVAISGAFARSIEVCRFLKHSLKYYTRMYLSPMTIDGKLQEVSRALAGNLQSAMDGNGLFIPILAAYDSAKDEFLIYFFDGAGARFAGQEYAAAGSGSERIRGVFEYLARLHGPWSKRKLNDVLLDGLRMLDIAADLDTATGGFGKVLPAVRILDASGNRDADLAQIEKLAKQVLSKK